MSRRPIGYYVHHQGAGHWQRACLIAEALDRPVTLIGTLAGLDTGKAPVPVLDLPDDRLLTAFDGRDGTADRPEALHYAPVGADNVRARMGRLAAWITESDPALIVTDVSVEITRFARLMSVPTLAVRLSGNRTDTPHREAFRSAEAVLAFFPPELEAAGTPGWVRAKTLYAGMPAPGISGGTALEDGAQALDMGGVPGGEVEQGALMDLAVLAPAFAQQDGGGRGAVGDGLNVHGARLRGFRPRSS